MIASASFLYGKKLVVSSRWYGKLATVVFYVAIVSSFIIHYFNIQYNFDTYIYYLALIITIFALFMYYREFYKMGYVNKVELNANDREIIQNNKNKNNNK